MTLNPEGPDARTRLYMLDELQRDLDARELYLSPLLTPSGQLDWPVLLQFALLEGGPAQLAEQLRRRHRLEHLVAPDPPRLRDGAQLLAEGEFNRFYCRGICRRALDERHARVEVYQAREANRVRIADSQLLGSQLDARWLLSELRKSPDVSEAQVPGDPAAGLSVRLPQRAKRSIAA
ncbi:MAG TPA: hypothetical protein ENK18_18315 [Deltaproteobacteria bacterium]|nr:hypothetical protein [Deltaproteobacteria bacterium]